jgi:Ca-activated chloride channel homolog
MTLRRPELLWLIVPIALLILATALRGRRVALPAAFVRLLAVGCVLVAIAGPVTAYSVTGKSVVFVVDRSGSVPQSAIAGQARFINDTIDHLATGTRAGVVAFGGKATVVFAPGETPRDVTRISTGLTEAVVDRDHTNIAAGIRLARALLARGDGGQVFLLSDGQENSGDARAESEAAASDGVRVSPVKTDDLAFPPDVRVATVDIPETLWGGDTVPLRVNLTGNNPWKGTLHITIDGQDVMDAPVTAADGNAGFVSALPSLPTGTHVISASVQVTEGENRIPENDLLSVVTTVRGKPNVLMIEGMPGEAKPVSDALTASGVNVTVKSPKEIPSRLSVLSDIDAIAMVDVNAKDLTLDQMTTIQQSVRANGRGLIVLGGNNSYGSGAYFGTPLEDALPVKMGYAPGNQHDQVSLGIIIDRSGSMDFGEGSKDPKIALARTAANLAIDALKTGDEASVVVFNDGADAIVPLQPLTDNRSVIKQAVNGIRADGGTDIYAGMSKMLDMMRGSTANVKHIVLMTDGESQGRSDYETLVTQMRNLGITLTTIAIGNDADTKLLQHLADIGGGKYYFAASADQVPQITLNEAQSAGKQPTRTGNFHPSVVKPSPVIGDIRPEELPNLDGYQVTEAKPNADVILESGQKDPVLAQWQYGLGRVVAWTPDSGTTFAKQWPAWSKYGQFWHQALLWALPDPNTAALTVDTHAEGDQVVIGVDATDVDGKFVNSTPVTGTLVTPDGKSFPLRLPQVGPGRYEIHVQAATPGAYRLTLAQPRAGGTSAQRDGGFAVPYSAEYSPAPGGAALLSDIAAVTGGSVLASPTEATDAGGKAGTVTRFREWWGWFAVGALVLFLLDLGLRLSLAPNRRRGGQPTGIGRLTTRLRRPSRYRAPTRRPPPSLR